MGDSKGSTYAAIRMQDPLKQGLKLNNVKYTVDYSANSNARSTKTRIETL